MNIKMIVAYDGTRYFGWQRTKMGPSVQGALEEGLYCLLGRWIEVEGASRTDRGVHARGQVVSWRMEGEVELEKLAYRLNAVLAWDIRVLKVEEVEEGFHPSLDALGKEYRYRICNEDVEDPMNRLYAWHVHERLDWETMRKCAKTLLGTHDFGAFTTMKSKDTIRTLFEIEICALEKLVEIRIVGDRFLYKMMRRLVGTLVGAGRGKISEVDVIHLLETPDPAKAGVTAPAHGLFLQEVYFTSGVYDFEKRSLLVRERAKVEEMPLSRNSFE